MTKATRQTQATPETKTDETFIITGKVMWPSLRTPGKLSKKYELTLSLDDKMTAFLEEKGVVVREEDNEKSISTENDRGNFVTLKQSVEYKDKNTGELKKLAPPTVIDGKGNIVSDDIVNLIGNGSIVNIRTSVYNWKNEFGKRGKSLNLGPIQIKTLVKYESKQNFTDFPEESFDVTTLTDLGDDTQSGGNIDDDIPF